jgi:quinone-modifying oxidoreductase subunit QmoC
MELLGGHGCKDAKGLHAILKKAQEIEEAKIGIHGA